MISIDSCCCCCCWKITVHRSDVKQKKKSLTHRSTSFSDHYLSAPFPKSSRKFVFIDHYLLLSGFPACRLKLVGHIYETCWYFFFIIDGPQFHFVSNLFLASPFQFLKWLQQFFVFLKFCKFMCLQLTLILLLVPNSTLNI